MKVIWEESDIRCGMIVYRSDLCDLTRIPLNVQYLTTVTYQVGFITSNIDMVLTSVNDGLVMRVENVVDHLNRHNYQKLPYPTYLKVIEFLRDRLEGNH